MQLSMQNFSIAETKNLARNRRVMLQKNVDNFVIKIKNKEKKLSIFDIAKK